MLPSRSLDSRVMETHASLISSNPDKGSLMIFYFTKKLSKMSLNIKMKRNYHTIWGSVTLAPNNHKSKPQCYSFWGQPLSRISPHIWHDIVSATWWCRFSHHSNGRFFAEQRWYCIIFLKSKMSGRQKIWFGHLKDYGSTKIYQEFSAESS